MTWTTDDSLFVLPTYQSIKLTYIGVPPISATSDDIAMGQAFSFQWETRAPVYAPAYDKNGSSSTNPYEYLNSCNATSTDFGAAAGRSSRERPSAVQLPW